MASNRTGAVMLFCLGVLDKRGVPELFSLSYLLSFCNARGQAKRRGGFSTRARRQTRAGGKGQKQLLRVSGRLSGAGGACDAQWLRRRGGCIGGKRTPERVTGQSGSGDWPAVRSGPELEKTLPGVGAHRSAARWRALGSQVLALGQSRTDLAGRGDGGRVSAAANWSVDAVSPGQRGDLQSRILAQATTHTPHTALLES